MQNGDIVNSITRYMVNHPECRNMQSYQAYNLWAAESGQIIKDEQLVSFLTSYILDLQALPLELYPDLVG